MRKVKKVLGFHFDEGRSARSIATQCGVARRSVALVLERFEASGLSWPEAGELADEASEAALYQAATVMLYRGGPNWLKAWALCLTKLRGKKRATVALARRIGVVLHRMWRDGTEFCFTRKEAMALRTV